MFSYIYHKELEKLDYLEVRYGQEYWVGWILVYLQLKEFAKSCLKETKPDIS